MNLQRLTWRTCIFPWQTAGHAVGHWGMSGADLRHTVLGPLMCSQSSPTGPWAMWETNKNIWEQLHSVCQSWCVSNVMQDPVSKQNPYNNPNAKHFAEVQELQEHTLNLPMSPQWWCHWPQWMLQQQFVTGGTSGMGLNRPDLSPQGTVCVGERE